MAKQTFIIEITGIAEIEIDDAVLEAVDDEWRGRFYDLRSINSIAEHIAYNLVLNKWPLSQLDGWADQLDDNAIVTDEPDWSVTAYLSEDF